MTCGCGVTGVYNEILGKGFYYCQECKKEITLEETPTNTPLTPYLDNYWDSAEAAKDFEDYLDWVNNKQSGEFDILKDS